jgi:hypothetical protein
MEENTGYFPANLLDEEMDSENGEGFTEFNEN